MRDTSSEATSLKVVFENDVAQEGLVYSGQTLLAPLPQLCTWELTGTPIRFDPTTQMRMLSNLTGGTELLQTITAMRIYSGKSIEELRLEDYSLKRPCYSHSHLSNVKVSVSKASRIRSQQAEFLFKRSEPKDIISVPMSTTTSGKPRKTEETVFPSPVSSLSFSSTPDINFTSESDPASVFIAAQPPATGKEPISALTACNQQQLRDALLQSSLKCLQIQNSLYRLVLLKLQAHVTAATADGQTDSQCSRESKGKSPKAPNTEGSRNGANNAPSSVLCELKEPLEGLMHCAGIQRSLFQKLIMVNLTTTENEGDQRIANTASSQGNQGAQPEAHANMMVVQYDFEEIAFKNKMECDYARNPFTNLNVTSTNQDVVHNISITDNHKAVSIGTTASRWLPHGRGSLKTAAGKLLYSGEWHKGKRHGKGEAPVFPSGHSPARYGYYTGTWKHNMRHGRGKMLFCSGAVYEGQWKFDKMTGYGTLRLPDGTIREGTWREGSLHGCAVFTWPHGVSEYVEYDADRGQLSSCYIKEETVESVSRKLSFRSRLMNLRECVNELKDEKRILTEQLNACKVEHMWATSTVMASLNRMQTSITEKWKHDLQSNQEEFDKKLKETESRNAERIRTLEQELEQAQSSQQCQICFERPRDCIIMPCTHLLYCRGCVSEHKRKGENRCPACRGPISGEILCNLNHSS